MQIEQRRAENEVLVGRVHQPVGIGAPAERMIAFQPNARTLIQSANGCGDLVFDKVGAAARRVVSRSRIPSNDAEIVVILRRIVSSPVVVTAISQPASVMPHKNGLEIPFFAQINLNFHRVHFGFGRYVSNVRKQTGGDGKEVVSHHLFKSLSVIVRPLPAVIPNRQQVVKEIV